MGWSAKFAAKTASATTCWGSVSRLMRILGKSVGDGLIALTLIDDHGAAGTKRA